MKNFFFLFAVCFLPLAAHAQNEWVLQPYIEVTGSRALQYLGRNVSGFMGSFPNNPYNVAVSEEGRTGLYSIHSPNDTSSKKIYFGENVVHGDFNGDHYTDFAIWKNLNFSPIDTVILYWGTATGIDTSQKVIIYCEAEYTNFGQRMCTGDINGDSFDDLVITASSFGQAQGKAYGYWGSSNFDCVPDFAILGEHRLSILGVRCAIGDLNNDRFADLVIRGSDFVNPSRSFDYLNIYFGGAKFDTTKDLASLKSVLNGPENGLSIFDCNGDTHPDLLWTHRDSILNDYRILSHFGGIDFSDRFLRDPDFIIPNPDSQHVAVAGFGVDIANAGDMNGDGDDDIVVGTDQSRGGNSFIFVFSAGRALDAAFDAAKGQSLASDFGYSVSGIGDVNGDGLSDIIVGAPEWKFGTREGYWGIFLGDSRIPTSVQTKQSFTSPERFVLSPNFPNPFSSDTHIKFSMTTSGNILIKIFNINGQLVRDLLEGPYPPGNYTVHWDGTDWQGRAVPNGVYFLKMLLGQNGTARNYETRKLVIVR
jgi:hypothetical protein